MDFEDKLRANLAIFDCKIMDESVLQKFADIYNIFKVDEDGIVEYWIEFVEDKSSSTDITVEKVEEFEKWCITHVEQRGNEKHKKARIKTKSQKEYDVINEILEKSKLKSSTHKTDEDEDILEMYGFKKDPAKNIQQSPADPEVHEDKEDEDVDLNSSTIQSKSGEIVVKFGQPVSDWKNALPRKIEVTKTDDPHVLPNELFFFNQMSDYNVLHDMYRDMAKVFCKLWEKDKEQLVITSNVREKTFNKFRTWGRIFSDNDGKLTSTSVLLTGDPHHWYHSLGEYESEDEDDDDEFLNTSAEEGDVIENGDGIGDPRAEEVRKKKECIPLDVSRLKCYSFFPGQVVGIEGRNPTKEALCAYKILAGLSFPPSPPKLNEQLQIVVASGPFTAKANDYQPLYNLMAHVAETEPNLLILVGPFVIDDNSNRLFQDVFDNLLTKIMSYVEGKSTQVVLISSYEDAHHDGFYPTPEFRIRNSLKKPNLHLMPDPCTLYVDGLIIGVTSVDIIRHLSSEEISYNMPRCDRLGRIAEHLLLQSSYYPLYPPSPEVPLDILLWADCSRMNTRPHILLVPSAMQYFYKYSNGTHIINPSKISKGLYSQLSIRPDDKWSEDCISGEILRV
ncbi:DNA polymerase alpha subunit B [Microplitis demolitor]|uniref:DNA polymerase alpha subunit B n=1 Tax=Microplitis demolitor TaxID=69319 RepID=UPI0004CD9291|nr:DNA polymerase alpha subunit B [Microplitis demolitor]